MTRRGLVIFDLDGTLFEAARASVPAVQEAFRRFDLVPPRGAEIRSRIGRPSAEFRAWLGARAPGADGEALLAALEELEERYVAERGRLYPGVVEMLEDLGRAAGRLAICSNGSPPWVERVVTAHDLAGYFDEVACRRAPAEAKPALIRGLLARLAPRPAVVVGDRREDVEAGRENGLAVVGATYGYGRPEELAGATLRAGSPREAGEMVRRLLGS